MAAQELKVRRETLLEQFKATQFELATVYQEMAPEADVAAWEQNAGRSRAARSSDSAR